VLKLNPVDIGLRGAFLRSSLVTPDPASPSVRYWHAELGVDVDHGAVSCTPLSSKPSPPQPCRIPRQARATEHLSEREYHAIKHYSLHANNLQIWLDITDWRNNIGLDRDLCTFLIALLRWDRKSRGTNPLDRREGFRKTHSCGAAGLDNALDRFVPAACDQSWPHSSVSACQPRGTGRGLLDTAFLPGVSAPMCVGLAAPEIRTLITLDGEGVCPRLCRRKRAPHDPACRRPVFRMPNSMSASSHLQTWDSRTLACRLRSKSGRRHFLEHPRKFLLPKEGGV